MNKNDIKLGLKTLKVKYHNCYVGTLALTNHGKVAFSYDNEWHYHRTDLSGIRYGEA